jgi:uncharacterized lipoprotein
MIIKVTLGSIAMLLLASCGGNNQRQENSSSAVGTGQVYMTSKRDSNGSLLRADKTYKLHVPKDVPIKQFYTGKIEKVVVDLK